MDLIIETERLILRPLELSDSDDFFIMNNNPKVNAYIRNPIKTITEAKQYVKKVINDYQNIDIARFAVILKETNKLIGFSGLKFRNTEENNHVNFHDLGYRFSEEYWNNGFATEAAIAWLDYGFYEMKLSTIFACAFVENTGSNKVLNKLGFEFMNQYSVNNTMLNWYKIENEK